jgi:hypothetical protein
MEIGGEAVFTAQASDVVFACPALSCTRTVRVKFPAVLGVPERIPLLPEAAMVSSCVPETSDQVNGTAPPEAVNVCDQGVPTKAAGSAVGEPIWTGVTELTVCATVADVLEALLASPAYEAESEWLPTANAEVL